MEKIILILGLLLFIEALFIKWNVYNKIAQLGASQKSKFFYNLCTCMFCLRFHFSVIITLIVIIFAGYYQEALITPFVVTGLSTLKQY